MFTANGPYIEVDNLMLVSANKHLPDKAAALSAGVGGLQMH